MSLPYGISYIPLVGQCYHHSGPTQRQYYCHSDSTIDMSLAFKRKKYIGPFFLNLMGYAR